MINPVVYTAIIFLFTISLNVPVFSQELWTSTSTGSNNPSPRSGHTAVWTGTGTNLMIVWGGFNNTTSTNTGGIYNIQGDSWSATSTGANVPVVRNLHTAVWTGSKMIIWGGWDGNFDDNNAGFNYLNTGGVYDPSANTWMPTSLTGVPSARYLHTAVWTGTKMIVWGGENQTNQFNTGGIYDPSTDTWLPISTINAPSARISHTAVWTGSKMIIWGGATGNGTYLNNGGIYDPASNTWAPTSNVNAPSTRWYHTAVWSGSKMIIWGGANASFTNTGGVYDPLTDTWASTTISGAVPSPRVYHSAVWTGSRMIVWGGAITGSFFNTGGIYDPTADSWAATTTANTPTTRGFHSAIITDSKMILWGGRNSSSSLFTGGIYSNPPIIGITKTSSAVPAAYSISQNYPNPFNPTTNIKFEIPKASFVTIKVYDVLGNLVSTLANEKLTTGVYTAAWDASNFPSGVYFYKITAGDFNQTIKMMLVK